MSFEAFVAYLAAGTVVAFFLWQVGMRYGVLGLLIVSSPIHRLSVDIGFSLKLLYLVILAAIAMNMWRATGDPFVVRTNRFFRMCLWLFGAMLLSTLVNGATATSLRHLIVLAFVFAGCYLVQSELRTQRNIAQLVDIYLLTGLVLGISGLAFYGLYLFAPGLSSPGGLFDAVTYDPDRTWTVPVLQSVDVGSNAYALSVLPFLFIALGEWARPRNPRRAYPVAVASLLFANLLLTFSRGGVIAFVVTVLPWVFLQRRRPFLKVAVALAMFAAVPFAPRALDMYREYSYLKGSFSGEDEALLSGRLALVASSLDVARKNPVFGVGEGNITEAQNLGKQAHNTYLELLAENGILAFAIAAILFGVLVRQAFRARRAFADDWVWSVFMSFGFGLVSLLVALIPTSALTMPLLWIQGTVVFSIATVFRAELASPASAEASRGDPRPGFAV